MPQIIRGVRHTGVVATLGPNGFVPYRATKDALHHDGGSTRSRQARPVPLRPKAKRPGVTDTATKLTAKLQEIGQKASAINGNLARMSDSLDRLDGAIRHARESADQRRASGFGGRV